MYIDYWICSDCESKLYGMCEKCGKCGRVFTNGNCTNIEEFPPSEEE